MQKRKFSKKSIKQNLTWYSFIIVTLVALVVLVYRPTISTFYYSFTNMETSGTDYQFIGFNNYKLLLTSSTFLNALKNTILLAFFGLITIPIGFLIANAINSLGHTRLQGFFRVTFYLPNIITGVSVVLIFQYVLKGNGGLLNQFPNWSHVGATMIFFWMNLGYSMLMNLASLQSIPEDLYDAASIDGAGTVKRLLYITIPLMKSCFSFLFVTSMITGLARFTDLYILGGNSSAGRPNGTLQTILMYIYQYSFEAPKYGISSTGAVVLFVLVFIFTIFNVKISGFLKEGD